MAVIKENYIQIPVYKCSGDKGKTLNEIIAVLNKNGYITDMNGGILTIVKEPKVEVKKEEF